MRSYRKSLPFRSSVTVTSSPFLLVFFSIIFPISSTCDFSEFLIFPLLSLKVPATEKSTDAQQGEACLNQAAALMGLVTRLVL